MLKLLPSVLKVRHLLLDLLLSLVAHHAAVLPIAECDRAPIAKSLPCLQCQGCCLMHQLMTYTH